MVVPQDVDHRHLVEEVAGHQGDPVLDVGDALEVERARPPDHAADLVALVEQELGQVGAVLAGDAGDQCSFRHAVGSSGVSAWSVSSVAACQAGGRFSMKAAIPSAASAVWLVTVSMAWR